MKYPHFELQAITVTYSVGKKNLIALNNVSLSGKRGETIGIVGESGSGKSTLGKSLLALEQPTSGKVIFRNQDLSQLSQKELRKFRKHMQMIFQDPDSSLNPRMTIKEHLLEAFTTHDLPPQVNAMLKLVHLPVELADRYPYELSGGQKQRVSIARALSVEPELLVLDEPLSSLDASIRLQILDLLKELQIKLQLTYLFITHDLATLRFLAHRVAVFYLGHLVELAPVEMLYRTPLHPYTKALLSAVPIADPEKEKKRARTLLLGEPPSPLDPPTGCPFHTRCPFATALCRQEKPLLKEHQKDHFVACHFIN